MVKINMVVNKSPEIWSILSLADRLLFLFFPSVRFLARKEDPFHHARRLYLLSASTLSRASFGVQNDSLLYFTISLYHPISSSPLPPPQSSRRENKERNEYYLETLFSRRKNTSAAGIKPAEYSCFRDTPTRFSFAIISFFSSTFFLDASDKKDWWA